MTSHADADAVARRSAEVMLAQDRATAALGMTLLEVGAGRAVVGMQVRDDMLNGWGTCHGAMVAAVADTAFAVACNSSGEMTVAAGFDITFLAPARAGEHLLAKATLRSGAGRSGVYDVTVVRRGGEGPEEDDVVVAEFRGRSRSLGRPVEEDARA